MSSRAQIHHSAFGRRLKARASPPRTGPASRRAPREAAESWLPCPTRAKDKGGAPQPSAAGERPPPLALSRPLLLRRRRPPLRPLLSLHGHCELGPPADRRSPLSFRSSTKFVDRALMPDGFGVPAAALSLPYPDSWMAFGSGAPTKPTNGDQGCCSNAHDGAPPTYSQPRGFRAAMTRRESLINFTQAARSSHERLSMLDAASGRPAGGQVPLRLDPGGAAYDMKFSIGTPPQKLTALADTGSDLIWLKCGACAQCTPRGTPSYHPNKSSSFSKLPCTSRLCGVLQSQSLAMCSSAAAGGAECDYKYPYGLAADSHHYSQGYLAGETFTLGDDAVPGIGFGCTTMSESGYGSGGSGLVSLGRGPLSLVSQLNAGAFSYCLTTKFSKSSPLLFGALAALSGAGVQSTPLLPSSTFYAVDLETISIGSRTTVGTGDAGIIFDSGTTVAFLAEPAYTAAQNAVLQETKLPRTAGIDGYEACFLKKSRKDDELEDSGGDSWKTAIPSMVLRFAGADMALPRENYFGEVVTGVVCWIVQKSPSLSIVGNIMQMSFHIRYDVDEAVLSFQPANCDSFRR